MGRVLLLIMLSAFFYPDTRAQNVESFFSRIEVSSGKDAVRFNFINGKSETAVYLINGKDSLKTRISGDFIRSKYVLKEENGIKKLYIYLRPEWNYDNIKGMGFGKTYLSNQRVQRPRYCF